MSAKKAFVTGITGQDGYYLSKLLIDKGYEVSGLIRRTSNNPALRFEGDIPLWKEIHTYYGNMRDVSTIRKALEASEPDEIYNLAALSDVGISFKCPAETLDINYFGVGRIVHEAQRINSKIKIYQASTSEMFGRTNPPQNEDSPFQPVSPYAEAKLRAHEDFIKGYRELFGLFACSGILFNHESPFRGEHFVTRKITKSLAKIKLGLQETLELGNLDAKRDWGFAGDYVEAMHLILQQDKPDDYVIATGISHSVKDFVNAAAGHLNMKLTWEGEGLDQTAKDDKGVVRVKINEKYYRPNEVDYLLGDASKAKSKLGWKAKTSFDELVKMMVLSDLEDTKILK